MVVVGPHIHKCELGREVEGQKPKTEHNGSVLGYIRVLRDAGGFYEVKDPPAVVTYGMGTWEWVGMGGGNLTYLCAYNLPYLSLLPSHPHLLALETHR